ncbi:hypothetical protein HJB86_32160 [Rhizobium sp. NZLR3b]|nr:hypothetical protein [Rhizobium sp. NZLR3b]
MNTAVNAFQQTSFKRRLFRGDRFQKTASRNFVQIMNANSRANDFRDFNKVTVVREVNDLPVLSHLGEQPESLLRAEIVESLHDVVCKEWNGTASGNKLMVSGHS